MCLRAHARVPLHQVINSRRTSYSFGGVVFFPNSTQGINSLGLVLLNCERFSLGSFIFKDEHTVLSLILFCLVVNIHSTLFKCEFPELEEEMP